jgi:hypothetical protein
MALLSHAPPFFLPSYRFQIKWGTVYCLSVLNFRIPYLPRTELKSGSDGYIPLQDNAENRCDLPLQALPPNGRLDHAQKYLWSATPFRHLCVPAPTSTSFSRNPIPL